MPHSATHCDMLQSVDTRALNAAYLKCRKHQIYAMAFVLLRIQGEYCTLHEKKKYVVEWIACENVVYAQRIMSA